MPRFEGEPVDLTTPLPSDEGGRFGGIPVDPSAGERRANLRAAQDQNPDQYATAFKYSRELGLPVPVVSRNLPEVEREAKLREWDQVLAASPALADAFRRENFAGLAHDDIEPLSALASVSQLLRNKTLVDPANLQGFGTMQGPEASLESVAAGLTKELPQSLEGMRQGARAQWADLFGFEGMRQDALRRAERNETARVLSRPDIQNAIGAGVYGGAASLVRQAPGFALMGATGGAGAGLAFIGAQTEAEGYTKYRGRGANPGMAFSAAVGEGSVEVATELLPMRFVVDAFGKKGAGEFLRGLLGREIPSEQVATLVQDAIDTAVANPDKTWAQYLTERPEAAVQTLVATITQAGTMGAVNQALYTFSGEQARADAAQGAKRNLDEATRIAQQSKLRERAPEEFNALVSKMLGEDADSVHLGADEARTFFQSNPEALALVQERLPEVAASLEEALVTGGDVVIPAADYVTYLAEYHDALALHIRLAPDAMTAAEAEAFAAEGMDSLVREADQILAKLDEQSPFIQSADEVQDFVRQQILGTGRFPREVADQYAALHRAFAVSMADRLGVMPAEVYQQYGLRVQGAPGATPQTVSPEDVARLRERLASSRRPRGAQHPIDARFTVTEYQAALRAMPAAFGWAEKGGTLLRDEAGNVTGRTPWVANDPELMEVVKGAGIDKAKLADLIDRAIAGERLGTAQDALVRNLLELAAERVAKADPLNPANWSDEEVVEYYQRVFHGSPHRFDKFSLGAIGSGEGAQAYGWGLYFASKRSVAEYYRDTLERPGGVAIDGVEKRDLSDAELYAAGYLRSARGDYTQALANLAEDETEFRNPVDYAEARALLAGKRVEILGMGQLYEANIPEDEQLLDWDKPLREQPEYVQEKLKQGLGDRYYGGDTGENLYQHQLQGWLADELGIARSPQAASKYLNSLGIPGLRYLDATSRDGSGDSHNYVIWDEAAVTVEAVNDELRQAQDQQSRELYQNAIPVEAEIAALRAKIAALEHELRTSPVTGLRNQRAFDEDEALGWLSVAAADLDGLKRLNSAVGHKGANNVLHTLGAVLLKAEADHDGVRAYHLSGDEFAFRFQDPTIAEVFMRDLQDRLDGIDVEIEVETDAGVVQYVYEGIGLSYGLGESYERADQQAERNKIERLLAGKREDARGDEARPPRRLRYAAGGQGSGGAAAQSGQLTLFQGSAEHRGAIAFPADLTAAPSIITLLERADLSTLLHESGHFFLEVMLDLARRPGAPATIAKDAQTLLDWYGIKGEEPPVAAGNVRVYHSGEKGEGRTGRWVSTSRKYASGYRPDLPLFYIDLPASDPRVNNPDYQEQSVAKGFTFNFELTPEEATHLAEVPRESRTAIDVWDALAPEQRRGYHEQFARGFEAYLFDGKAPSLELQGLFARFAAWLKAVYRQLAGLNVTLTDEVRGVMDRLLATDEAIRNAEEAAAFRPMFESAEAAGMTATEFAEYQALAQQATQEATEQLQTRSLRDMRWLANAKARVLKELQADAKAKRQMVRAEVTREVWGQPIYRVMHFLKRGELPNGEPLPEGMAPVKFAAGALREMYGEADDALWRKLPVGKYGMTAKEGVHPDTLAELFGFPSGDALVRGLIEAEDPASVIEGMTDQRMLERYGDIADARAMERAAEAAIHNEARARFVAAELRALNRRLNVRAKTKRGGSYNVEAKAAKAYAEYKIAQKPVRDAAKSAQYAAAEARAAKAAEAALRKGDAEEAARQKRAQLLNNHFYRAAKEAEVEIERAVTYLKKFDKANVRKAMRGEFLAQLDALLARFDLRKSVTNTMLDQSLVEWTAAEAERLSAVEPDLDPRITNEGFRKHYKLLTLDELRALRATVKQLEHLARREQQMYIERRGMAFAAEERAILEEFYAARPEAFEGDEPRAFRKDALPLVREMAGRFRSKFDAEFLNVENMLDIMTLGKGRQVFDSLLGRLSEAADEQTRTMKELAQFLQPYTDAYSYKERLAFSTAASRVFVPEVGEYFTRDKRLAVALFYGSAEGRQRLADGNGYGERQVQAILATLDNRDLDFIEALWRMNDELIWPRLKALDERTKGLPPGKVDPLPFRVASGRELRGGYVPLVYDGDLSTRAYDLNNEDAIRDLRGGTAARATTRQSASKARAEQVNRPLELSLAGIAYKVNETVHDVTHREAVTDTYRLLQSKRLANAIRTIAGPDVYNALLTKVRETAVKPVVPRGVTERALWYLRRNTLINMMGASFNTVAINVLGVAPALRRVGPRRFLRAVQKFASRDAKARYQWVMEKSPYMRERADGFDRDLSTEINRFTGKTGLTPSMSTWFAGLAVMDRAITVPTWMAAYEQAMEESGNDEATAVQYADRVIRQTQGAGRVIDLAKVAGGVGTAGEFKRIITMFYNFFNAQLGQVVRGQRFAAAQWNEGKRVEAAGNLTLTLLAVVVVPATLEAIARGNCGEDPSAADYLYCAGRSSALFTANFFPILRDVVPYTWHQFDTDTKAFGVRLSPVESALETVARTPKSAVDAAQGEATESDRRTIVRGIGYALGLPGFQASRTLEGYQALMEGKTDNPAVLLTGSK